MPSTATGIHGPTVADARRSAQAIAAMPGTPHVHQIMLFGSVARGEANNDSDIDLIVLVDDLGDYALTDHGGRRKLKDHMETHAETAVPHSVDVHITDPREWTVRAQEVTASFEASLASDLITLVDRPAIKPPDWSKPMSKPATNLEEASAKFDNISDHLSQLCDRMLPSALERVAEEDWMRERELKNRRRFACGHAADAIEMSVKTVMALQGVSPSHIHNLEKLINQIPSKSHRTQITAILTKSGITLKQISAWHVKANYANDLPTQWEDAKTQMPQMIKAAHAISIYTETAHSKAGGKSSAPGVLTFWLNELNQKATEGFNINI